MAEQFEHQIERGNVADVFRGRSGIYIRNLNRVQVELAAVGKRMELQLTGAINKSVAKIAMEARGRAPRDTGMLQASIRPTVARRSKRGVIRSYVRAKADYAAWVEFGSWKQTKKKSKAKMPNIKKGSPLYVWAMRHGIPPFALAKSMSKTESGGTRIKNEFGRLIGRKRARSAGAEKKPFLGPAFVQERPKIYRRILNILRKPGAHSGI